MGSVEVSKRFSYFSHAKKRHGAQPPREMATADLGIVLDFLVRWLEEKNKKQQAKRGSG